jgi:glycosyltransferase involved in cell wall biosynthesis
VSGEEPIRVAMLNPCYWPEVRRGSERFIRELADGLIGRGHRPRLLTAHPGWPSTRVEDGLEVRRAWRPPEQRLMRRGYSRYLSHVPFSYLELMRGDDQVAQALYPTDALASVRWSARTGRPAIFSLMGIPDRRSIVSRRGFLETVREACHSSRVVVTLSRAARDATARWLGVDSRVIAPAVDMQAFEPGGDRSPGPTVICAAAIGEPRKRVELLVRAFALVRRARPDARLVLSRPADGGGEELARVDGVELADLDGREALAGAYRSAWVSALPATGEAFGLVLAEAMACGTPVVATDDGGIPDVVGSEATGRLVAPGGADEPERFAAALLDAFELAGDPSTAQACREQAQLFSVERCAESYEALYREVLGA